MEGPSRRAAPIEHGKSPTLVDAQLHAELALTVISHDETLEAWIAAHVDDSDPGEPWVMVIQRRGPDFWPWIIRCGDVEDPASEWVERDEPL